MAIWYIGYFDTDSRQNRNYILAATNKMRYIAEAMAATLGLAVEVVSISETKNKRFYRGRRQKISDNIWLKLFPTIPNLNALTRRLSCMCMRLFLFFYLISHVQTEDQVVVYHSTGCGNAIHFAKKLRKFRVILEVEEIYQDVKSLGKRKNRQEYRDFQEADAFIFSSELLNQKLNTENKPYVFIYGTYQAEEQKQISFEDGKVHVVYAGTFSSEKGGAESAVAAAQYLSEDYHIHILGFGTDAEIQRIQQKIQDINQSSDASVTCDGLLQGEEYIVFLQRCQIGLSTQNPSAKFNNTSFPSKILSYMANGLRVVTVRIPAVEISAVGEDMYYYDKQDPQEIAAAIQRIDFQDGYDGRRKIRQLDAGFRNDLKRLLAERE